MKNFLIILSLLVGSLFYIPSNRAYSQDPCKIEPSSTYCKELKKSDGQNTLFGPDGIVTRVTQFITIVAGVASVIMLILGGLRFVTSEGVPQRVASARNTIIYSAIGVVITLLAQSIVSFILSRV